MTRVRGVVGVCAVSATLFLNGAALAVADTGSDGGTSSQTGTSTGAAQTGAGAGSTNSTTKTPRPVGGIAGALQDRVRTTVRDFTGALGGAGGMQPGPKVTIFPKPRSPQQSSESGTAGSTVSTATPSTAPTAAAEPAPTTSEPTAATTPAASDTTVSPSATSSSTTSTTTPTTAASTAAALAIPKLKPPPVIPIAESVSGSVYSAANSVKDAVDALPALLAALPKSTDPVGEVLKTVQSVLTSLGNSVTTITEIPSDLTTLLGFPTPTDPVTTTVAGGVRLPAVTAPAAVSPIDLLPALLAPAPADATVAAPAGPAAPAPTFAGTVSAGLSQDLAPATPVSLQGATSAGSMASVLERAVSKLLVPVSIAALAALALPGVGGLLVVSVLGVRIGYRQAKANFVLQTSGISRFAGPGPLGVVRSGSFIALHTRTARTRTAAAVPLRSVSTAFDRAA
ncbi:hypothetical protein QN239_18840 [Mycolicibacterium sp. Y3]